jgi:hypothetical protein
MSMDELETFKAENAALKAQLNDLEPYLSGIGQEGTATASNGFGSCQLLPGSAPPFMQS